ncbi:hypothetical protein M431DRAFT_210385 [Trichoderma harzianum CBS 226.95]|uniref:Uncharacterized protein n=1 Tax=Trichoderma harzianum CBS 226.95 TaxID=983964 RepID=A0A2T4A537_TRIHA|nr:hypothetical protein M431DRAFT_210385 [Trichoderma harzianum CBS 226.95]PTB52083.1 hypothetical protein M431DRAFT_210385 [Trichoderma harzianum CBS 226.95]
MAPCKPTSVLVQITSGFLSSLGLSSPVLACHFFPFFLFFFSSSFLLPFFFLFFFFIRKFLSVHFNSSILASTNTASQLQFLTGWVRPPFAAATKCCSEGLEQISCTSNRGAPSTRKH